MGSRRDARHAGRPHATTATSTIVAVTATSVAALGRLHTEEQRRHEAVEPQRTGEPGDDLALGIRTARTLSDRHLWFLGLMWLRVFNDIGFGQWFRYVTGVVELLGGCLLLVPRATLIAVAVLICTMAGALLVHITVVGIGPQTVAVSVLIVSARCALTRASRSLA